MGENINYKTLALARESRGYSQTELEQLTGISQSIISRFERGTLIPDDKQIKKFTEVLGYPRSFFQQQIDIYPPNLHYRKKAAVSARIKEMAEAKMNIYRSNIDVLINGVELPDFDLPVFDDYRVENPVEVASFIRHYWKLPKGRVENLTQVLEQRGILVIHCDFKTDKIDGRSMITRKGNYIIFLNKDLSGDRLRFTLAHEFAHIILHINNPASLDRDVEEEANLFACEFLMPSAEVKPQIAGSKLTIAKLADLKRYWRVSMQAILKWADHLKLVTSNHARYLWSQFNALSIRLKEPVEVPVEKAGLLEQILNVYLKKLGFSTTDLAHHLYLDFRDYESMYLMQAGPLRILK